MFRKTIFASFVTASLLASACTTDEEINIDDIDLESDGKGDHWGLPAEHKLLDESRQPEHVMMDASYVYFILFTEQDEAANPQTRSVIRVRRSDGKREKIAVLPSWVNHAALGGNTIWFTDHETLWRVPKTGGQPLRVGAFPSTWAIAADASAAYVAHAVAENEQYFHRISKVTATSNTDVEVGRATFATSLAVDDTHVYWLDETQPNPAIGCGQLAGFVKKAPKTGGITTTLQAGVNCPISLAVDGTSVFYTYWDTSGITGGLPLVKLSKHGGLPTPFGVAGGNQIMLTPSNVYWLSPTAQLMRRSKLALGLPVAIASDVDHALQGADAMGVYFWREHDEPRAYSLNRIGL